MPKPFPTREEIVSSQLEKLRQLFEVILPANRFYRRKLSVRSSSIKISSLDEFSKNIPFTTKEEIVRDQIKHPPYGTNLTFPVERYTRFHQTSGTTGTPIRWLDTPESWQWMVESWKEVFRAAGISAKDRVYFAFSFGPFIGFWLAYEAAQQLGCLCLPGGGVSSEARLRMIIDNKVTALCCTPTYAIHLAEVAGKMKINLRRASVNAILVAGEPGGSIPATRARLEKLWPTARIFDHHGMTEVGPVTYECPRRAGVLHVMESAYIAEIIKPASGQTVQPGETGELVLTTLGRFGSPLIRYRTGDLVRQLKAQNSKLKISGCICGRHELALEGGILGRVDDMVIVRGVNIYPSAVEDVLRQFAQIAEYRVLLKQTGGLAELSLEIEPVKMLRSSSELEKQIARALHGAFSLRIAVSAVPAGSLPRFEMKAQRWLKS
jgi:phenylacetate-CoA ligase